MLLDGTFQNLDINLHAHFLFADNIAPLLEKYHTPLEFDLLSCDMDSHDLFVLNAIFEGGFRPRVVTTEYNSNYPLEHAITLIDPTMIGANTSTHDFKGCAWGASASALRIVAEKFGYTLIGVIDVLDLMWLRNDLFSSEWEVPNFEWFFSETPLGALHHPKQSSAKKNDFLLDYEVFDRIGDLNEAKSVARSKLTSQTWIVSKASHNWEQYVVPRH